MNQRTVRLTQTHTRGSYPNEQQYRPGAVLRINKEDADWLVSQGAAVFVFTEEVAANEMPAAPRRVGGGCGGCGRS